MARRKSRNASPAPVAAGRRLWPGPDLSAGPWRWLIITLALWTVLAFIYPGPMFEGKVFQSADSSNADAFAAVGDASLKEGHYPLWNPYLFGGMPTFGPLAFVKYLYPPSVIFNFLQGTLGFPPLTWLLGHLLFGGLGMAWLLSRWRLPLGAVLLGTVAFLLFPRIVAWGVHGHGTKLGAAMYLPWIVGWALRVLDGGRWRAVGMTGLLLGLQLLRGHPQITYYTLLAVGWLGLWLTLFPAEEWTRQLAGRIRWLRLGQLGLGLVLGFAIGAIMLLPGHEYAAISIRGQDTSGGGGVGLEYATDWSLAPVEMGTLVLPAAAGFGQATYLGLMPFTDYPNYFGFLFLILAVCAWWSGARSWFLALGTMSLLALLVSFGNFGFGFYELLYNYLPFFNKFRVPAMILVLVALAAAILAARGVTAWSLSLQAEQNPRPRWPLGDPRVLPGVLVLLGAVLLILGMTGAARSGYVAGLEKLAAQGGKQAAEVLLREAWYLQKSSLIRIGLLLLTAGAAVWAAYRNPRRMGPVLPWVLLVLLAMDLGGVDRLIVHPEKGLHTVARDSQGRGQLVRASALLRNPAPAATVESGPGAAALAEVTGHDRLWPLGQFSVGNFWMADGIRSLGGYHPAKLAAYEKIRQRLFNQEPAGHLANWLAGRTVVFDRPLSGADLEYLGQFGATVQALRPQSSPPYFYRNATALPRARLVGRWQPVSALPEKDALEPFLDALQAGQIDYRQVVHLTETPDPVPAGGQSDLPAPVFLKDGLDEVVLQVSTPEAALLLLADMDAPGWKVDVNGQEKPLLQADLVLRAVALPAGDHEVRFHYSDPAVRRGLFLSIPGLLVALLLVAWPLVAGRLRREGQGEIDHD